MGKLIDLTNKKFGKLTVLSLDIERNKQVKEERRQKLRSSSPTFWLCKCDCGNTASVKSTNLRSGHTSSCGCNYKKYDFEAEEMIGQRFGKWTITAYHSYNDLNRKHFFCCKCDCGTESIVDGYNLVNGSTKDCGCGRKSSLKTMAEKDLCGESFGRLTVVQKVGYNNASKVIYKCRCECGQYTNVVGGSLTTGHTTSCGCTLSKNNLLISAILDELKVDYVKEKVFNVDNFMGRFDFYLPSCDIAIEYDGEQHFYPVDFAGRGEEWARSQFELTQKRDKIKNDYCRANDIKLLRIPYYKKKDMKDIITDFINSP